MGWLYGYFGRQRLLFEWGSFLGQYGPFWRRGTYEGSIFLENHLIICMRANTVGMTDWGEWSK